MKDSLTYWLVRELCIVIVALLLGLALHYSLIWALTAVVGVEVYQQQEDPGSKWDRELREVKRT